MGTLLIGMEKIVNLMDTCTLYEHFYLEVQVKLSCHAVLEKKLTELYAKILLFIIRGKEYLTKGSARKTQSNYGSSQY